MEAAQTSLVLARQRDLHPAIWMVVGTALIACALALFDWAANRSPARNVSHSPAQFASPGLITSIEVLAADRFDAARYGSAVLLSDIRVESVVGDYVFLVEGPSGVTVPIVLLGELTGRQSESKTEVKAGQDIRVFGTVLPMPDLAIVTNPAFISDADAARLERNKLFIFAMHVTVTKADG